MNTLVYISLLINVVLLIAVVIVILKVLNLRSHYNDNMKKISANFEEVMTNIDFLLSNQVKDDDDNNQRFI